VILPIFAIRIFLKILSSEIRAQNYGFLREDPKPEY
jgi:hypothetical protein